MFLALAPLQCSILLSKIVQFVSPTYKDGDPILFFSKGLFWALNHFWGIFGGCDIWETTLNFLSINVQSYEFKTTSSQNFGNILVQISPNQTKLHIFEIYMKRDVGKCPRLIFLTLRKPRKSINKSGKKFCGHPVLLHIFKIKDQKQKKLQNLLKFFWSIYQNVIVLATL